MDHLHDHCKASDGREQSVQKPGTVAWNFSIIYMHTGQVAACWKSLSMMSPYAQLLILCCGTDKWLPTVLPLTLQHVRSRPSAGVCAGTHNVPQKNASSAASSGWTNQAVALTDRMEIYGWVFFLHESLVGPRRSFRVLHYAWQRPEYAPRGLSQYVFIKPEAAQSEIAMRRKCKW